MQVVYLLKFLWSFHGRIGRLAYVGGLLLSVAWGWAALWPLVHFGLDRPPKPDLVLLAISLVVLFFLFWSQFALTAKRLHDLGKSGWISLVLIVPVVSGIAAIYLLLARGNDHDNAYGPAQQLAPLPQPSGT